MQDSFIYNSTAEALCLYLSIAIFLSWWAGLRVKKKIYIIGEGAKTIEGSLFALLGLFLAFTFSMSGNRFDIRRAILTEEANTIGTAILRSDLYPDSIKNKFREDFRNYLEARIAYYDAKRDVSRKKEAMEQSNKYVSKIWQRAAKLSMDPARSVASIQMIPALNNMIDIVVTREIAFSARVPDIIIYLLFAMTIACSFFAGFSSKPDLNINWLSIFVFLVLTVMAIYVILDLDRPLRGIINLDRNEKAIEDVRMMFN